MQNFLFEMKYLFIQFSTSFELSKNHSWFSNPIKKIYRCSATFKERFFLITQEFSIYVKNMWPWYNEVNMWPWYNEVNIIRTRIKQMSYRKFKYKQHKKHNHKYLLCQTGSLETLKRADWLWWFLDCINRRTALYIL